MNATTKLCTGAALTALLAAAGAAAPAAETTPVAVGVHAGTLGLGIEASALVGPNVAVRVGYNGYMYHAHGSYQDVDYDGHLRLSNVPLLADLYPMRRGTFHLTAGVVINNNKITADGRPSGGTYTLNGQTFSASDVGSLNGAVTFRRLGLYLGVGNGKPSGRGGLQFVSDVGVLIQGTPSLSLTRSGGTTDPTLGGQIDAALSAERDRDQHDVNRLRLYPVLSVGLAYSF